jgi:hypothetical protein
MMETKQYTYVDKSKWKRGIWDSEPDKIQFEDEATKMPCLIVRGPSGSLCGYVGVSEGHPLFGIDYSSCSLKEAKPKGITEGDEKFGEWSRERSRKQLICSEKGYCSHTPESILEVHGGITFTSFCHESKDHHGICHIPAKGEPDKVWWFGFDCAHSGDESPAYDRISSDDYASYKDIDYVKSEIAGLAKQLKSMS